MLLEENDCFNFLMKKALELLIRALLQTFLKQASKKSIQCN